MANIPIPIPTRHARTAPPASPPTARRPGDRSPDRSAPTGLPPAAGTPVTPAVTPALTPAALRTLVSELAERPEEWIGKVRLSVGDRWYERLSGGPDHEIWLISWLPGQSTGFHDHGGSRGAFTVALGELEELSLGEADGELHSRRLPAGTVRAFGPAFLHDVRNTAGGPAVTIHAYSPPLSAMARYELRASGLRRTAVEVAEQW
ncbi:hypothetical protein GCM10009665_76410 [Kitasatospora nipponensis]|uniref:Cysteine dioxygenase type I n=1 Tax=Kitasatospora nipponensis TaxID=258049 RepID=A0ABP4DSK0_9ACTN